jgi:hypothetical protein
MNKPFWKSKINWISAIAIIFGFLTDPKLTELIDPWWAAQILKASGVTTLIISQWFTQRAD